MFHAHQLILASTSPFRRKLLEDAGVAFNAMACAGDEKTIVGFPPRALARQRAEFKAIDVGARVASDSLIIGADQVLSLDGAYYDKADSAREAEERLMMFQGRTHFLHSAYCLVVVRHSGSLETVFEEVIDVPMTMRKLTRSEVQTYVATEEWKGCVGCYRVEGRGIQLFDAVGGDHPTIIGLPLISLFKAFRRLGFITER